MLPREPEPEPELSTAAARRRARELLHTVRYNVDGWEDTMGAADVIRRSDDAYELGLVVEELEGTLGRASKRQRIVPYATIARMMAELHGN